MLYCHILMKPLFFCNKVQWTDYVGDVIINNYCPIQDKTGEFVMYNYNHAEDQQVDPDEDDVTQVPDVEHGPRA